MIDYGLSTFVRLFTGARAQRLTSEPTMDGSGGQRPRIYFANHTSMLDFVLLWSVLPDAIRRRTRPVAAHDYWSATPLRRWIAASLFRAVLIERKHVTRATNPLDPLLAILAAGESLILFPEGGRHDGPTLAPFKSGLYHLAQKFPHVELIPVYVDNLNRVLPKGEILPIPLLCSVTFGAPFAVDLQEPKADFLVRAQNAVARLGAEGGKQR